MRVQVYPADHGACGNLRLRWPAQGLDDVEVLDPGEEAGMSFHRRSRPDGSVHVVFDEAPADVVVIQRPVASIWTAVIPGLQRIGVKVVVDLDDDLLAVRPTHIAYREYHPAHSPERNWENLRRAVKLADRVTVTTKALMDRYGDGGRGVLVPNCVPASTLEVDKVVNEIPVVGWAGWTATHPGDLAELGNGLVMAARAEKFRWKVIGYEDGVKRESGLTPDMYPWCPPEEYAQALASLDIGIAPLAINPFNQSKSWLKPLEYAAAGVPFVCSPTEPYLRFTEQGAGLVAAKPKEWTKHLRALLASADLRGELASRGREVAQRWTIEGNLDRWQSAWQQW